MSADAPAPTNAAPADTAAPHIHLPDGSCCKPKRFAHLHQHTQYSLLDGAAKLKDLLEWARETSPEGSQPALAMTDHGNMHGAVHFYNYAQAAGVKPILGYEAYVVPGFGTRRDRTRGQDGEKGIYHLTLLARDFEGYQNLCRLSSRGYTEGYYYKPRIDHELLQEHSKGVIAFSGCLGSEVQQLLLQGREKEAKERLLWYRDLFGENYYIEIQNHGLKEQANNNPILREWARELGIGMVATNDGHYVKKQDATAHETLLAIQTKATLADENRFKFPCDEFYVKNLEEMQAALPVGEWGEEVFDNAANIADLCNVTLPVGKNRVYQMPALPIPKGRTMAEELRVQTYAGAVKRYPMHLTEELLRDYAERSLTELGEANSAKVVQRVGCQPSDCTAQQLYTLLAFLGSVWEARGKEAGEKFTPYPALNQMEAEAKAGNLPAYAQTNAKAAQQAGQFPPAGAVYEGDPSDLAGVTAVHYGHALTLLRRTEYELSVINNMGFPDYFLIVADYINWAKDQGISVGPGRGSGAGSLVAYAMRITNLDPLEFDLLFERFLNPDRVSMPDFDIDFNDARRMEVVEYVQRKYGEDKVAQIATFGTMSSKACLKDVARVMSVEYSKVDKLSKLIPVKFGRSYSLEDAREAVPDIAQMLEADPSLKEAYEFAQQLEGLTRHASVHAAGVVIGREELTNLVPIMRDTSGNGIVCQYDMKAVEDIGLIKMDFLGLRTLSFLDEARRILRESKGIEMDFDAIPFDDQGTFDLMSRGDTKGVFQLEGAGITDASRRLRPRRLTDIIALSALYRPGPMENIPTYLRRHHGQEAVTYDDFPTAEQWLEPILRETYGIPLYQEQITQIASDVAGYTLGQADLLRRAMGKKIASEMVKHREIFVKGAATKGVPADEANRLFDLLDAFANYGFNKCLTGDALIPVAGGELRRIDDLYHSANKGSGISEGSGESLRLPSVDGNFRIELRATGQFFDNGIKPVFRVKTALGRELTATANHPLLTLDGWRNVEDLAAGERIAAPARLPELGTEAWPTHEAALLGWILAENNSSHPRGTYLYSPNQEQARDMAAQAEAFADTRPTVSQCPDRPNVYNVYLGTGKRTDHVGKSDLRLWLEGLGLEDLGLSGKEESEKAVPAAAFRMDNASLAVMLGRYWSGNGFICDAAEFCDTDKAAPYLAAASKQLADDLAHLLLRLGMIAKVTRTHFKHQRGGAAGQTGYRVQLVGRRSIQQFLAVVASHTVGCTAQLSALREYHAHAPEARTTLETVAASSASSKALYGAPKASKTLESIAAAGEFFDDHDWQEARSQDLYWDTITAIEPAGEAQTYDLEMPETHNFVANGLIVHNSHSAAYGVITYQTAWLKANYPVEFMAALLTVERRNSDKVSEYISDARKMQVTVLPPDINRSSADFAVAGTEIYFGLYAIKGLGENAVQRILEERERGGNYKSLADFCARIDNRTCNRKGLESLIKSGAFDAFGERKQLLASLESALKWAVKAAEDANNGMESLFGETTVMPEPELEQGVPPFSELERLAAEKEALGLYISGHPLEQHEGLREAASCRIADLDSWFQTQPSSGRRVKAVLAGMIEGVQKKPTKSGKMMARFILADESGQIELVAFTRAYERCEHKLVNDTPALIIVELEAEDGGLRAIAEEVITPEQLEDVPKVMYVNIDLESASPDAVGEFQSLLDEYAGTMPTYLRLETPEQFVLYQLAHHMGSTEAIRVLNDTFAWANAYLAYDQQTILGRFAPKPPAWLQRTQGMQA